MNENEISFGKSVAHIPSNVTLKKYGLMLGDWIDLFNSQHGKCGICHNDFKPGQRINVDHLHVKGWNKMAPSQRKRFVRGLLCFTCNRFMVMRGVDSTRLWNAWMYMRAFEVRVRDESHQESAPARAGRRHPPATAPEK